MRVWSGFVSGAGGRLGAARPRFTRGSLAGAARGRPARGLVVVAPGTLLRPRHQSCEEAIQLVYRERANLPFFHMTLTRDTTENKENLRACG
ncbi:hypothetical protein GCM10029992_20840 [Glycomyces albus]